MVLWSRHLEIAHVGACHIIERICLGADRCVGEECLVHGFVSDHVHHQVLVGEHTECVVGCFIDLELLEALIWHVLQCDADVVLEERLPIESHLLDVLSLVGQPSVLVEQAGEPAHEFEQYGARGHLEGLHIEHGGVAFLIHLPQLSDDGHLLHGYGVADEQYGVDVA